MLLRGLLEQSLGGFVTVRGYARLGDLERISIAAEYQRNLIDTQKERITEFLSNKEYLFFPEVILGYKLRVDYNHKKYSGRNPLKDIIDGREFHSNVDSIRFYVRKVPYNSTTGNSEDDVRVVSINLDDVWLQKNRPFLRIDGNHRLSAANEDADFYDYITPFSLILFQDDITNDKYEKTIFYNINSKSIPLTSEEGYRVLYQTFEPDELKTNPSYGLPFYYTALLEKRVLPDIVSDCYNSFLLPGNKQNILTVLITCFKLLLTQENIEPTNLHEKVYKALVNINSIYSTNEFLKKSHSGNLLISYVYIYLKEGDGAKLDMFTEWILRNRIYNLIDISSKDLIDVYDNILLAKQRQVFVSMPFNKRDCENHFKIMKRVIDKINLDLHTDIKILPLRIDNYIKGESYKISDEILEEISKSGLLIADLTHYNQNVYHEVGFMMGLARGKGMSNSNVLLIVKTQKDGNGNDITDVNIGFNIRGYKQLRFNEAVELEDQLDRELRYRFKP